MSKKTESIYKAIENLEGIQEQIAVINQLAKVQVAGDEEAETQKKRHLEKIEFEMLQELKALRFWVGSLYTYNGKSKSRAKQSASKENGKKGGRPPKEITLARRRIAEIEEVLVPELESKKNVCIDPAEEERLSEEIRILRDESVLLGEKLTAWAEKGKAFL